MKSKTSFSKKFSDKGGKRKVSSRRRPARERPGFEDIRSSSTGKQEKPEWFSEARPSAAEAAGRRQEERRAQRADPKSKNKKKSKPQKGNEKITGKTNRAKRSSERSRPGERPRPNERRVPKKRPRRKPMSLFKRRALMVLTLLFMLLGTGFLAESLLLRVTSVQVAGDQVYPEADILRICGIRTGDNLLLIPADDREKKLETELPYIARARISRRIPGTVTVEITAARGVCCIQSGAEWYTVSGDGKVLETGAAPREGLMQVLGVAPKPAKPGEDLELEGEEASNVFLEIAEVMGQLGDEGQDPQGRFTRADLTDLYNIRLWYQDRVECRLGSSAQLEYKLRWAWGNLTNEEKGIGPQESGVLDLTYLPTKKRSYFTPGDGSAQAAPNPDGTVPSTGTGTPAPSPTPGRGDDIPDGPFTGGE